MSQPNNRPTFSVEEIARRAYKLWEESGYVHGHDREHWLEAESQLVAELIAPQPSDEPVSQDPQEAITKDDLEFGPVLDESFFRVRTLNEGFASVDEEELTAAMETGNPEASNARPAAVDQQSVERLEIDGGRCSKGCSHPPKS